MSLDAAFLAAVLADPASDTPRLVYADWLEERGDPRGEFIRLQCALACPPAPPRFPAFVGAVTTRTNGEPFAVDAVTDLVPPVLLVEGDVPRGSLPEAPPFWSEDTIGGLCNVTPAQLYRVEQAHPGGVFRAPWAILRSRSAPHGGLVGVQLQLLPDEVGKALAGEPLRRREQELLRAHPAHPGWLGSPDPLPQFPKRHVLSATPTIECLGEGRVECTFRRGFIDAVTLTAAAWLAHGDAITAAQPVREVSLTTWTAEDHVALGSRYVVAAYHAVQAILTGKEPWPAQSVQATAIVSREDMLQAVWPRIAFTLRPLIGARWALSSSSPREDLAALCASVESEITRGLSIPARLADLGEASEATNEPDDVEAAAPERSPADRRPRSPDRPPGNPFRRRR